MKVATVIPIHPSWLNAQVRGGGDEEGEVPVLLRSPERWIREVIGGDVGDGVGRGLGAGSVSKPDAESVVAGDV